MTAQPKYNFQAGEVLLVNKPLSWTSFDVVNKLRYNIKHRIGVKKIKVGHAGTLDPLADGLLIICTGKQTKSIEQYMGLLKGYSGIITLGATTPSYDLETEIDQEFPTDHLTDKLIKQRAQEMIGDMDQYPPIFSAKKVKGKKAYDLARQGKEVKLKSKRINISRFDITKIDGQDVHFYIECSKGTYIRSIAHDFGKSLDSGAYLKSLRRERIGEFKLEDAHNIDSLINLIKTADVYIPDRN